LPPRRTRAECETAREGLRRRNPSMDRESVSEVVRHCLDEAFGNLRGKRAGADEWTREIKTQLCLAGAAQQPPLRVCASGVEEADDGEWLYDVCWLRYGEDPDCLNEVVLILECEWGGAGADSGRVRDDFHKLVAGRARVRCMIWKDGNGRDDSGGGGVAGGNDGRVRGDGPRRSLPARPPYGLWLPVLASVRERDSLPDVVRSR